MCQMRPTARACGMSSPPTDQTVVFADGMARCGARRGASDASLAIYRSTDAQAPLPTLSNCLCTRPSIKTRGEVKSDSHMSMGQGNYP